MRNKLIKVLSFLIPVSRVGGMYNSISLPNFHALQICLLFIVLGVFGYPNKALSETMDETMFWEIIDISRAEINLESNEGNFDKQLDALERQLENLSQPKLLSFNKIYMKIFSDANTWRLWEAAYVIGGGCSNDCFMDFRSWIISMGKDTYALSMESPDELARYALDKSVEDYFFNEFGYVAQDVYERKFGEKMPQLAAHYSSEPSGEEWDEYDSNASRKRFPKLAVAFDY